jgi:hypothetical protein
MSVSIQFYHGGNMDNAGFYKDKHGIYPYIPGINLVHASVITECTVSAGPSMVVSRMYVDVHGWVNLCMNRRHLCSSIENIHG